MADRLTKMKDTIVRYNALFVNEEPWGLKFRYYPDQEALEEFMSNLLVDFQQDVDDASAAQIKTIVMRSGRIAPDSEPGDVTDAEFMSTLSNAVVSVLFFYNLINKEVRNIPETVAFKEFTKKYKGYILPNA